MDKKKPPMAEAVVFSNSSKANTKDTAGPRQISPRQYRTLKRLQDGPATRKELDLYVGASNSPQIILTLRRMGVGIECELLSYIDRDGKVCRYGLYSLIIESICLVKELLKGGAL